MAARRPSAAAARAPFSRSAGTALWPWLGIAAVVVLLDQLAKTVVVGALALGESRRVAADFNIVRWHNSGAAFSFLSGASGWQRWFFVTLAVAAVGVIVWLLKRHGNQRLFSAALAFILGGAVGNVIDRLIYGHVVDFIQVHHRGWFFSAFNLADSAITLGAGLLILDEVLRVRRGR